MAQPATGKLRFTNANANTFDVTLPVRPYTARVAMALDGTWLSNGQYSAYDHGVDYDVYSCDCVFELNATEHAVMASMYNTVGSSYGRAQDLSVEMANDSGFHPFGPNESNIGAFNVSVIAQQTGQLPIPYKGYKWTLTLTQDSTALPDYSLPTEVSDGGFEVGTVTGLRFPMNWCNPLIDYRYSTAITQDGDAEYVDRGTTADKYTTSLVLVQSENKMAALAEYIVGTARAAQFNIVSPAGTYPFGYSKGDGTFAVKLAQSALEMQHIAPNQWQTTIDLSYISGPT